MNSSSSADVVDMVPQMGASGLRTFRTFVEKSANYLEYGCGGSTLLAANSGVSNIFSVETDGAWAEKVRFAVAGKKVQLSLTHCDVGKVGAWGRPIDDSAFKHYYKYATAPWEAAQNIKAIPDLVLVDGRFRVASFLYSLLCAEPGTTILFDDYAERKHYHVVEKFCDISSMQGRMAVFTANLKVPVAALAAAFARYSIITD